MKRHRRRFAGLAVVSVLAAIGLSAAGGRLNCWQNSGIAAAATRGNGRIVILMVWDGLRPDLVDRRETPTLFSLSREGVRFEHQHAVFPTVTMVNAASLATGGLPSATGIFGDRLYLLPELGADAASSLRTLDGLVDSPLEIENSHYLAALNGPGGFDGYLLGVESVAQQVLREGGYIAIIGKQGPTFLFDDQIERAPRAHARYLFVADDQSRPPLSKAELAKKPRMRRGDLDSIADRDQWLTRLVVERALPAAREISAHGHPALIVFWQHNPDLVQHLAGLGTQPALNALRRCDANLASIRAAIGRLGIAHRTDLMVVSDHGFATVRMAVSLADLLVRAGIKESVYSKDIVVARNGGDDLVYLSRASFGSEETRRATLARIVDFAEAQEWCGPIFSRRPATGDTAATRINYPGWIPGTFAQAALGLSSSTRSPDLIISFRELPELDNRGLTGPHDPAFALGLRGQVAGRNVSFPLVRPVNGVVYADSHSFATGLGTHGAAGARELHNFCAADGPDFRRHFVDLAPTGNADIAPTIRHILRQNRVKDVSGRILDEALRHGPKKFAESHHRTFTAYLVLQGQEVITTLSLTEFGSRRYLDGSSVARHVLGGSP